MTERAKPNEISRMCAKGEHGWCMNRTPQEANCGCQCHIDRAEAAYEQLHKDCREREAQAKREGAREALVAAAATQCSGCKRGDSPTRPPHRAHIPSDYDYWHENAIQCHAGKIVSLYRSLIEPEVGERAQEKGTT